MIVLAKKIVMDKVEPIPNHFDRELNGIIMYGLVEAGRCSKRNPRRG